MTGTTTITVIGAGQIGKRHIDRVLAVGEARLGAIVDPAPASRELAARHGAPWFESFAAMLAGGERPDGAIVATPNRMHVDHGLAAIAAGIPTLVEKPIADSVAAARVLVDAAEAAGVPLLVGHHRRHNPIVRKAKAIVDSGRLGRVIAAHGFFWLMKPDSYFDAAWRREAGAGPLLINAIHDIDLLRHLCGDIVAVRAMSSNAMRGHAVEETAVALLEFANGALGSVSVSDGVVAPWSWEHTTGENSDYPRTDQCCYFIGGTHGSLSVPRLELWSNPSTRGWREPFDTERFDVADEDPLRLQIEHFCRVIRGEETPLVSGREGLKTLAAIEAIKISVSTGNRETVA